MAENIPTDEERLNKIKESIKRQLKEFPDNNDPKLDRYYSVGLYLTRLDMLALQKALG